MSSAESGCRVRSKKSVRSRKSGTRYEEPPREIGQRRRQKKKNVLPAAVAHLCDCGRGALQEKGARCKSRSMGRSTAIQRGENNNTVGQAVWGRALKLNAQIQDLANVAAREEEIPNWKLGSPFQVRKITADYLVKKLRGTVALEATRRLSASPPGQEKRKEAVRPAAAATRRQCCRSQGPSSA